MPKSPWTQLSFIAVQTLLPAAVLLPDSRFDDPHAGAIGLLDVLGNPEPGLVPGLDVAVVEGEIGGLVVAVHGRAVDADGLVLV